MHKRQAVAQTASARIPRAEPCPFDVAAVGCSAGGYQALVVLLKAIPAGFPTSIIVIQHLSPVHKSLLVQLLSRQVQMQVKQVQDGELMLRGVIYVAPPDEHVLVSKGGLQLAHSQLVHFSRPSIDMTFVSVARMYGRRAIGMLLSGTGSDGVTGLRTIKLAGGTTLVQDPASAEFDALPRAAIACQCADCVLPLEDLGPALMQLCTNRKP